MGLSVSANSGNGLANLFRQARSTKQNDDGTTPSESPAPTAVSLRPLGRSGIDSTGSGTAQISAALTVYLSKLGGPEEENTSSALPTKDLPAKTATVTNLRPAPAPGNRSGAADLLRVLDAYGSGRERLTA